MATYKNIATGETYKLGGVKNIGQAWKMASVVCSRMNWNEDMFAEDVIVRMAK